MLCLNYYSYQYKASGQGRTCHHQALLSYLVLFLTIYMTSQRVERLIKPTWSQRQTYISSQVLAEQCVEEYLTLIPKQNSFNLYHFAIASCLCHRNVYFCSYLLSWQVTNYFLKLQEYYTFVFSALNIHQLLTFYLICFYSFLWYFCLYFCL